MSIKTKKIILFLGDLFFLYFSLFLTTLIRFLKEFNIKLFLIHLFPFSILYFFWIIIFYVFEFYEIKKIEEKLEFYKNLLIGFGLCFLVGISFFYLLPFFRITPKTNLFLNILIFLVFFLIWRKTFSFFFSQKFITTFAFVGDEKKIEKIIQQIPDLSHFGYKIEKLDPQKPLLPQLKQKKIEVLIVPPDISFNSKLAHELYNCLKLKVNFLDWVKFYEIFTQKVPIEFLSYGWFLENLKEGEKKIYDKLKRIMDVVLGSVILGLSLPLWIIIALLIKLEDKGEIFYKQKRVGKEGKVFVLLKFRSMKKDAEKETGPLWAEIEDPRTTKIGRFLRKTHLDELPQMINILKGEISLVGPRPERPEFVRILEKEIPYYNLRHLIKPGFTGWAQIKFRYGRSLTDAKEKLQYDLYYLKHRSFVLDFKILLKTFQLFFKKEK